MPKKNIWASFQRIIELFTQKFVTKLSKIWAWDPGSEIWDPGLGVKKALDPGFRIRLKGLNIHIVRLFLSVLTAFLCKK